MIFWLILPVMLFTKCNNIPAENFVKTTFQVSDSLESRDAMMQKLSPEAYYICHDKGTEPPFSGKYDDFWEKGTYKCVVCSTDLFSSLDKFHSGSGWPSFSNELQDNVASKTDYSHGMVREEILCKKCGSHLGHVFSDGPKPSGLRYCVNSLALKFVPSK